jgi:ribosome-binding protein aMBF1 (putative translation factor)
MPDLGKRVRAARGYTNLSQDTLADRLKLSKPELETLEVGLEEPDDEHRPEIVERLVRATHLPPQFFTGDFGSLD